MYLKIDDLRRGMVVMLKRTVPVGNKYGQIIGRGTILQIYPSYILLESDSGIRECILKSDLYDKSCRMRCI